MNLNVRYHFGNKMALKIARGIILGNVVQYSSSACGKYPVWQDKITFGSISSS